MLMGSGGDPSSQLYRWDILTAHWDIPEPVRYFGEIYFEAGLAAGQRCATESRSIFAAG